MDQVDDVLPCEDLVNLIATCRTLQLAHLGPQLAPILPNDYAGEAHHSTFVQGQV